MLVVADNNSILPLPSKTEKINSKHVRKTRNPAEGKIIFLCFHKLGNLKENPGFKLNKEFLSSILTV